MAGNARWAARGRHGAKRIAVDEPPQGQSSWLINRDPFCSG